MEKIFYTDTSAYPDSETAVRFVLEKYFDIRRAKLQRNEHGKPYLEKGRELSLFFSVSHTENKLFIAVSDENVGIDAENLARQVAYAPILRRFHEDEKRQIRSSADFLRFWTAKESAVKWLGGSLANDLQKIRLVDDRLFYDAVELPIRLVFHTIENCIVGVCSERDFTGAERTAF